MEVMDRQKVKISVRNLVEFILRSGDIDNRIAAQDKDAMQMGAKLHRKIQKRMGASYHPEVTLRRMVEFDIFDIQVEGRADGIIEEERICIDEIKGVFKDLERMEGPVPVHLAQAKCYACIYAREKELAEIDVQMTYCNMETEDIRRFRESYKADELEEWFMDLMHRYEKWARFQIEWREERNASVKQVEFPYDYRKGQRELVSSVYRTILRKKKLFIQAPTGTGKTLATVFPAVKAVGEGLGEKIFYLTAKTITRTVAEETYRLLMERGLQFKFVTLTARDKICIFDEARCNPKQCERAKGHYDRVNAAVFDMITHETAMSREVIEAYAGKHCVCPFEMQLDAALWVDGLICDYNYVFDPRVNLKRYFGQGDYIFLVDEAHNLYERASSMYSAELYKEEFLKVKKLIKPFSNKLAGKLDACNRVLLEMKKECNGYQVLESIDPLIHRLLSVLGEYEKFLEQHHGLPDETEILEFYFKIYQFMNIYERVDENYVIFSEQVNADSFRIKLFCVDTSVNLRECLDKGRAAVFFSATLLPIRYYKKLLSAEEDYAIYIASPFPREHRQIMIGSDVSSRYSRRGQKEYEKIYYYIEKLIGTRDGNYMVFFPSYRMLQDVYAIACAEGLDKRVTLICQNPNMKEEAREEFLQQFEGEQVVAFCILGGIFAEGIDLTGERLIGTIVVGIGLPMVCNEREILRNYFEEREGMGFEYAYLYPGMNKVLQAAGRVIRTAEDHGVILLLDERFLRNTSRQLFPREWEDYEIVQMDTVAAVSEKFWVEQSDRK